MRIIQLTILIILLGLTGRSQQLSQITFAGASSLSWFSFKTDQDILIRISDDGKVLEWGTELMSERSNNYYSPKLQPYLGRVTYYGTEADSMSRGKLKSVGTCVFTYFGAYEMDEKRGKLKSVGHINLDYCTRFDNLALKGKLKSIGTTTLEYYSMFESDAVKGKLKSVGGTVISYNSVFDDKLIQGKIKSIGSVAYNWGTSRDIKYAGALRSGSYRQNINGIVYILQ